MPINKLDAITEIAARFGHLNKYYRNDWAHDLSALVTCTATQWLHVVRECGTEIIPLRDAAAYPAKNERVPYLFGTADRHHILDQVRAKLDAIYDIHPACIVHYYDGRSVRAVNQRQAEKIVGSYQELIRRQWEADDITESLIDTFTL